VNVSVNENVNVLVNVTVNAILNVNVNVSIAPPLMLQGKRKTQGREDPNNASTQCKHPQAHSTHKTTTTIRSTLPPLQRFLSNRDKE